MNETTTPNTTPQTTPERSAFGPVLAMSGFVVALVVLITLLVSGRTAPMPEAFAGATTSLADAEAQAGAQGKVVFAVATADWCPACQSFKRGALADPRVAQWMADHAVPVSIDVTQGPTADTERLGINAIPASFVLDSHGTVLAKFEGAVAPDKLLTVLHDAADASKTLPRAEN